MRGTGERGAGAPGVVAGRLRALGVAAGLLLCAVAFGQGGPGGQSAQGGPSVPEVRATITPDSILIGDRAVLRVKVSMDAMQVVSFPELDKMQGKAGGQIEVLGQEPVDTVSRTGRRVVLEKRYNLTSFDEGIYSMGRIPVMYADKNVVDTLRSVDSIVLKVTTFQIDTAKQQIFDIKAPIAAPLKFGEISGYLLWGLLALAVLAALLWLLYRYSKRLPLVGPAHPKPLEPAHIVALRALEKLYNQKTMLAEKHKAYYTALTEIIREYIGRRYGIAAQEMTSTEIVGALRTTDAPVRSIEAMEGMLRVADLVKFAKYAPDLDQNEQSYHTAYHFVEDTKPVEAEPQKESQKEPQQEPPKEPQ